MTDNLNKLRRKIDNLDKDLVKNTQQESGISKKYKENQR